MFLRWDISCLTEYITLCNYTSSDIWVSAKKRGMQLEGEFDGLRPSRVVTRDCDIVWPKSKFFGIENSDQKCTSCTLMAN